MTQSAIQAGYSARTAHSNSYGYFQDPEVQSMIAAHQEEYNKNCLATFTWKMERLVEIVQNLMENVSVSPLNPLSAAAVIKAIAEMNKMQGHYAPDKTLNANLNMKMPLEEINKTKELLLEYDKPY